MCSATYWAVINIVNGTDERQQALTDGSFVPIGTRQKSSGCVSVSVGFLRLTGIVTCDGVELLGCVGHVAGAGCDFRFGNSPTSARFELIVRHALRVPPVKNSDVRGALVLVVHNDVHNRTFAVDATSR